MAVISSVCVYCGSRLGERQAYRETAHLLGTALAENGIALVYGGGRVGLMGVVADAALAAGGTVTGIIPRHLHAAEVAHEGLSELIVVDSMHARKEMMFERADAFVTLPGGPGTLDETIEIITWRQLKLHDKPVYLLDHDGHWQPLLALFRHIVEAGFAGPEFHRLYTPISDVEALTRALQDAPAPRLDAHPERL